MPFASQKMIAMIFVFVLANVSFFEGRFALSAINYDRELLFYNPLQNNLKLFVDFHDWVLKMPPVINLLVCIIENSVHPSRFDFRHP